LNNAYSIFKEAGVIEKKYATAYEWLTGKTGGKIPTEPVKPVEPVKPKEIPAKVGEIETSVVQIKDAKQKT